MFLFDTDILSNILKKVPSPFLLRRLVTLDPEEQFTTSITVGELVYGTYRSSRPHYFLEKLARLVWPNINVLPFDEKAAHAYGKLRSDLEKRGAPLMEPDLRIAAIALTRDLTLVTGNVQHFSRISKLKVENWLK